jgi:hypothetical protein
MNVNQPCIKYHTGEVIWLYAIVMPIGSSALGHVLAQDLHMQYPCQNYYLDMSPIGMSYAIANSVP